jgi:hypothetical protein
VTNTPDRSPIDDEGQIMTDGEAERVERTARRSSAIAHGGSPLMPSHSQGAERRPERRAGRTGSRWLLRALVVGGLVGVVWLLTGSAAQAADPGGGPSGAPLGSLPDDVATAAGVEPTVGELLEAAVQPPESAPENHRNPVVTSILTTPETVGALPRTATASPRTSGGTAGDRALPVPSEPVPDRTTETASNKSSQVNRHIPAARPALETLHRVLPGDDGRMDPGHRLPVAADIEARRNDAVAPSVSPD